MKFGSRQRTLFGEKIISSVNYNETDIILDILHLFNESGPIELDPTYSIGNFYENKIQKPKYKFDLNPQISGVKKADCQKLPLVNELVQSIMFDPPFVIGGTGGIISNRFSTFSSFLELREMYYNSLKEFYRVLKLDGILIFKCQDVVESGKNYFVHCLVHSMAIELGYSSLDLFILPVMNRITDLNGKTQRHARKYHSYFWVFKKKQNKINY